MAMVMDMATTARGLLMLSPATAMVATVTVTAMDMAMARGLLRLSPATAMADMAMDMDMATTARGLLMLSPATAMAATVTVTAMDMAMAMARGLLRLSPATAMA